MALGVLEPDILKFAKAAKPTINVRVFPDILEPVSATETAAASLLREEMLARAQGRPIVSLLGELQPSKGVDLFLRAACDPRLAHVAFFMGGPLPADQCGRSFRARVRGSARNAPHLHQRLERLCESSFNAAVRASSILFAAYLDFPYSSNVQGKAAQFHKPIIVTEGTLMAERCAVYGLGEIIRENDLESLVTAIQKLLSKSSECNANKELVAKHDEYVAQHSQEAVRGAMNWVLQSAGL